MLSTVNTIQTFGNELLMPNRKLSGGTLLETAAALEPCANDEEKAPKGRHSVRDDARRRMMLLRPYEHLSYDELEKLRQEALVSPARNVQLVIDIARERHHRFVAEDGGTQPLKKRRVGRTQWPTT